MLPRIALSALAATTLALNGAAALAETVDAGNSVPVHFGDLDLKTDAGVAALKGRIGRAARVACGSYDIRDLKRVAAADACRKLALNNAAPEIELAVAAAHKGEGYASSGAAITVHSR
jgi:UrcA family protein